MNIQATLTRCRHGQALVQIESSLGNGMEIRPHDLRLLAHQLIAIADMAERLPLSGKRWKPTRVEVGAGVQPISNEVVAAFREINGIDNGEVSDGH